MSVYQRGDKWYINIQINGIRIQQTAGETRDEALLLQAMLRKEAREGRRNKIRRIPFDRATQEYLKHINDTLSDRSYELALTDYKKYLHSFFSLTLLNEINNKMLLEFQARQKATKFRGRKLANRTVNIHMGLVRKIMKFSEQQGYITETKLKYPMLREPKRLHAFFTPEEFKAVADNISYDLALKRFKFGRLTGMRPKELAYLAWDDIDISSKMLRVQSKRDAGFIVKTDEERAIPLNTKAIEILKGIPQISRWVFSKNKKPVLDIRHALKTAAKKAGISRSVTTGMLRHTFATRLLQKGIDIETLRQLMGHKSIETTQRYLHSLKESLKSAVEMLNDEN